MTTSGFEKTELWKRGLAEQKKTDEHKAARDTLRVAYLKMRDNTTHLVSGIHQDCRGLTVHDETHLDALWEMADRLIDETGPALNPAEIFVLGATFLLHDAGMAVAAYPGGRTEIRQTTPWRDNVQAIIRREQQQKRGKFDADNLPKDLEDEALFSTLRDLHAHAAERLATQSWPGATGSPMYLLEDEGLRNAYGPVIGRIAHSHHWNVDRLLSEFQPCSGAATGLPPSWTLNEINIACVLRCSDAAHIDERRAPSFLYALARPQGVSDEHWSFQNKLKQVATHDRRLVYASGQSFELNSVPAWWRAYDTITMINSEIEGSNAVLQEVGEPPLAVDGVLGANNPRVLSNHIKTKGWEPVRAEVTVSDPVALAKSLGGSNLYGISPMPVLRELLQNSADAVRARRKLESRAASWGKVSLTVETLFADSRADTWLFVDDDGIGMSQRVLTGPLLDFGRSFWNSSLMKEEFPGLSAAGIDPIGKFGIGFFSVFHLADHVTVASKKFNMGDDTISVVEFKGLGARPILRKGERGKDLPPDVSTRVGLRLKKPLKLPQPGRDVTAAYRMLEMPIDPSDTVRNNVRSLIASLDVQVAYDNKVDGETFEHASNWQDMTNDAFLTELHSEKWKERFGKLAPFYERHLSALIDQEGKCWGRAALSLNEGHMAAISISARGFSTPGAPEALRYVGLMEGEIQNVSRSSATVTVPDELFKQWLSAQAAALVTAEDIHYSTKLTVGRRLYDAGIRPDDLPVCFFSNRIRTLGEFKNRLASLSQIAIPVEKLNYKENFHAFGIANLRMDFATLDMAPEVMIFELSDNQNVLSEEAQESRKRDQDTNISRDDLSEEIAFALRLIQDQWGSGIDVQVGGTNCFAKEMLGLRNRTWALIVRRLPS